MVKPSQIFNTRAAKQRASAPGFLTMISKPHFLLAITWALQICQRLEWPNGACQGIAQSLSVTTAAVELILNGLKHILHDNVFQEMFEMLTLCWKTITWNIKTYYVREGHQHDFQEVRQPMLLPVT